MRVARRWAAASSVVLAMAAGAGCGKKGPPLAPYVLLPGAPARVTAQRQGGDVYVTLTVPVQNIDGSKPADVRRIEVYAFTATTPPPRARALELGTLIATVPVAAGQPEGALLGQRQRTPETKDAARAGATITVKDSLGPEAFVPRSLPALPAPPTPLSPTAAAVRPAPPGPLRRFYITIAYSDRGRPGPQSAPVELALTAVPDAPYGLQVEYTSDMTILSWQPPGGIVGFLLDNPLPLEALTGDETENAETKVDPLALPPGPTRFNVYRTQSPDPLVLPSAATTVPAATVIMPKAITASPVSELTFVDSVEFDRERCYEVRAVRGVGPDAVESAPSERQCVKLVDIFPPDAPVNLTTTVREGAIDLLWEPSADADVWGYLILRGAPGDATLQPLTAVPVIESSYTDRTVEAGRRYVYAVLAVDSRLPVPNMSAESARVEETAR